MNDNIYIHEYIDVIGHNRARYMHHMTANWCPVGNSERNMRCFGVWATVGSTGAWPQVVNLWELDGWDGLAANFEHELVGGGAQDPSLAEWWAVAADLRRGGFDRIVVPEPWSPTIVELTAAGVSGAVYAHEHVRLPVGRSREFLAALESSGRSAVEPLGLRCVGAFRVAMSTDSEAIVDLGGSRPSDVGRVRARLGRRCPVALARPARRARCERAPDVDGRLAAEPHAHRSPARRDRPAPAVGDRAMTGAPVASSLGALLDGDPDDVVVYLEGAATTRAELLAAADDMASRLREHGLERRAIGVLAPNTPGAIAAWFAVWKVRGAFVPLNPRVPEAERDRLVASTGVAAVIEPPAVHRVRGVGRGAIDSADAIIQFTSGTTGRPKAVPLRHDAVLQLLDGVIESLRGGRSAGRVRRARADAESRAGLPFAVGRHLPGAVRLPARRSRRVDGALRTAGIRASRPRARHPLVGPAAGGDGHAHA